MDEVVNSLLRIKLTVPCSGVNGGTFITNDFVNMFTIAIKLNNAGTADASTALLAASGFTFTKAGFNVTRTLLVNNVAGQMQILVAGTECVEQTGPCNNNMRLMYIAGDNVSAFYLDKTSASNNKGVYTYTFLDTNL